MTKSQRHRAENELVFKLRNDRAGQLANAVLDADSRHDVPLNFVCECSNEHCQDKVELTLVEYERIRLNPAQYVVRPSHEQTDIEMVVDADGHNVVEKFEPPVTTDGRLNATR